LDPWGGAYHKIGSAGGGGEGTPWIDTLWGEGQNIMLSGFKSEYLC
jgi:hypothetical protein